MIAPIAQSCVLLSKAPRSIFTLFLGLQNGKMHEQKLGFPLGFSFKDPRVFLWGPKIGVCLFFAKMALKTPPPLAKFLQRAALARQILILVTTALSFAFVGWLSSLYYFLSPRVVGTPGIVGDRIWTSRAVEG
jgi:hypothetical protein